jgi:hypothetical protein
MKNTTTTIPAGMEWRNATPPTMIAAMVAPARGIRSRIADDQAERHGKRHTMMRSTIVVNEPAIRLMRIARHVAADGAVDLVADPPAPPWLVRQPTQERLTQPGPRGA